MKVSNELYGSYEKGIVDLCCKNKKISTNNKIFSSKTFKINKMDHMQKIWLKTRNIKHYADDMRGALKCYNSIDKKMRYQLLTQKKTSIRK